LRRAAGVEEWG
jgi:hypothetical protein